MELSERAILHAGESLAQIDSANDLLWVLLGLGGLCLLSHLVLKEDE